MLAIRGLEALEINQKLKMDCDVTVENAWLHMQKHPMWCAVLLTWHLLLWLAMLTAACPNHGTTSL